MKNWNLMTDTQKEKGEQKSIELYGTANEKHYKQLIKTYAHSVVLIPGLGDDETKLKFATQFWKRYGLNPIVHSVGWRDQKGNFARKLNQLLKLIDERLEQGDTVSLVGTSAGGSAAINAFWERRDRIHKVVNVCGRLKVGNTTGFRSFKSKTATSPAFAESVKLCEEHLKQLTGKDKDKIMTIRAKFGDELVPSNTTIVEGTLNTEVPTIEHMFSITMSLSLFSNQLLKFLLS